MAKRRIRVLPLNDSALGWLALVLGLVLVPHLQHVPWWVGILFTVTAGWRWQATRATAWALPGRWLVTGMTLGFVAVVLITYKTLFGRDAGVALLSAMLAMKFLELRTLRDGLVLLMMGYLLVMANLLFSQSPLMAAYLLAVLTVLLAVQILIHGSHRNMPVTVALRLTTRMLLQSIPVMLILFFLFPRIPGPFWGLPKDAYSGLTGLSEEMKPGAISELNRSDAAAFRVRFAGVVPPPNQLYWRGPVLWRYNGHSWTRLPERLREQFTYSVRGEAVDYTVLLEPHGKRWLFALDLPYRLPVDGGITSSLQLMRKNPVNELLRYEMRSYPDYRTGPLEREWLERSLQLPSGGNPRTRALAAEWQQRYADPQAIVKAALTLFHEQPFHYTLTPPPLGEDNVDGFLFDTQRGFCEHFAGSFVFLMRAAGVPARVVTGYQGGENNTLGGYLIVRQSDAHAWAEVWLEGPGWVRVDPTAAVAPSRIEQGLHAALDNPAVLPFMARRDNPWLRDLAFGWDTLNNAWNEWVLAYGPERQREFLSGLGFGEVDWRGMTLAMAVGLGCFSLVFFGLYALRQRKTVDPVVRAYQRFCAKLARRGLSRHAHEGPVDFTERIAAQRPDLAPHARLIGKLYVSLRYGRSSEDNALRQLHRQVKKFKA